MVKFFIDFNMIIFISVATIKLYTYRLDFFEENKYFTNIVKYNLNYVFTFIRQSHITQFFILNYYVKYYYFCYLKDFIFVC